MSTLYIELKFINFLSGRLQNFKRKSDYLFNFRCPLCGDSSKKQSKTRGYFFKYKTNMHMKCHNCGASMSFASFLKQTDGQLYSEFCLENYSENVTPVTKPQKLPTFKFDTTKRLLEKEKTLIDELLDRLDTLPEDNIAVQFCLNRNIPAKAFSRLYFIDDMKKAEQLNEEMRDRLSDEPRLVMPLYDEKQQLSGLCCRAVDDNKLRYINVKIKEDSTLIFGTENLDKTKHIYVVEGPLDSLFLPNAIAVVGTGFKKLSTLSYSKENMTVIVDNQPRNKEVCKVIETLIDDDYNVVIWPQYLKEKDINDMVSSGKSQKSLLKLIQENTHKGLEAKAKFVAWRRC